MSESLKPDNPADVKKAEDVTEVAGQLLRANRKLSKSKRVRRKLKK